MLCPYRRAENPDDFDNGTEVNSPWIERRPAIMETDFPGTRARGYGLLRITLASNFVTERRMLASERANEETEVRKEGKPSRGDSKNRSRGDARSHHNEPLPYRVRVFSFLFPFFFPKFFLVQFLLSVFELSVFLRFLLSAISLCSRSFRVGKGNSPLAGVYSALASVDPPNPREWQHTRIKII